MDPLEPSPRDQYGELSMQMDAEQENSPFTLQSLNVKLCIQIICILVLFRSADGEAGIAEKVCQKEQLIIAAIPG